MWIDENKTEQMLNINIHLSDRLLKKEISCIKHCPKINKSEIKKINESFKSYIFYKRKNTYYYECFCTHCNSSFAVDFNFSGALPKHNEEGICPKCHQKSVYKSAGRSQKNLTEHEYFIIFKKYCQTVYAICIKVYKAYNGDPNGYIFGNSRYRNDKFERMPNLNVYLEALYIWNNGSSAKYVNNYYFGLSKAKNPITAPFPAHENTMGYDYIPIIPFVFNEDILSDTNFRYSAYEINKQEDLYDICAYLSAYTMYPILEMVMKTGLTQFSSDLIYSGKSNVRTVDWTAKRPKDFFKILNKSEVNEIIRHKYSTDTIAEYCKFKRRNQKVTFEECEFYLKAKSGMKNLKCQKDKDFWDKLYKYLQKQSEDSKLYLDKMYLYNDYYGMAEYVGSNMTAQGILYPRDLQIAHDEILQTYNYMKTQERIQQENERLKSEKQKLTEAMNNYKLRYKKLCDFYGKFKFEGLTLVVPEKPEDIIAEGAALEHCVGSYALRHIQGKTTILFVRKVDEPDKPYFTIEISERQVIKGKILRYIAQCHGYKNEFISGRKVEKPEIINNFEKSFEEFLKEDI